MEKFHEETKMTLEGEIAELHEARSAVEQETQEKADTQQHTEVKLKVVCYRHFKYTYNTWLVAFWIDDRIAVHLFRMLRNDQFFRANLLLSLFVPWLLIAFDLVAGIGDQLEERKGRTKQTNSEHSE